MFLPKQKVRGRSHAPKNVWLLAATQLLYKCAYKYTNKSIHFYLDKNVHLYAQYSITSQVYYNTRISICKVYHTIFLLNCQRWLFTNQICLSHQAPFAAKKNRDRLQAAVLMCRKSPKDNGNTVYFDVGAAVCFCRIRCSIRKSMGVL